MDNIHKTILGSNHLIDNLALIKKAASINDFNSYNSTLFLLNSKNWIHKIDKSLHLNSVLNTVIGTNNFWPNYHSSNYFPLNKFARAIPKIPEFAAIMGISSAINNQDFTKYINTTFQSTKLNSILWKHNQQLDLLAGITNNGQIKQLKSIVSLFNGLTAGIAVDAVENDDEENLNFVEDIVNRIADTTSEIYEQGYITKEDVTNIKERILDYLKSVDRTTWHLIISIIANLLTSLLIVWITSMQTLQLPANAATKQDIQHLHEDILATYHQGVEAKGISKRLATTVALRVGASDTSYRVCDVKSGTIVTVLDLSSKWAYISFEDSATGLPNCGWISSNHFVQHPFICKYKERGKNTRINSTVLKSKNIK